MEIWNLEALEGASTGTNHRPRRSLSGLLSAASRLRGTGAVKTVRWRKAIRALHAECDQLRRRMEKAR